MTKTTRAGFYLAIAGGLLAVTPPMAEAYTLTKLLALALGAAVAWIGLIGRPVRGTALDRPLAALAIVMVASTAASADRLASLLGMYPQQFYGLLPLLPVVALFYAAAACDVDDIEDSLSKTFTGAAIVMSAYAIAQRILQRPILTAESLPSGLRVTSTIGSPVMFGAVIVFLLPFVLSAALEKKRRAAFVALPLLLAALFLTWARGSWVSAAIAALAYFLLSGRVRLRAADARTLGLVCALAAAPAYLLLQRGMAKQDSDSMRVEMLKAAVPMLDARPWFGFGPDTYMIPFRRYRTDRWIRVSHTTSVLQLSAHNDLLQAVITLGWPGLAAYLWLIAALALEIKRRRAAAPRDGFLIATAAGLTGLFLQAKVNPITPSAIALAAIVAGVATRRSATVPRAAGRPLAAGVALALAAAAALLVRLNYADILFRRGIDAINAGHGVDATFMAGVNDLRRATEVNPWSLNYLSQRCEVIFRISRITPPDQTRQLLDKALLLTEDAVRRHPGNPTAHELRSTALTLSSRVGENRLREAMAEIKIAGEMDPVLTFTMRRRMDLARMLGDRAEFERAKAEYLRVIALTVEAPDWNPIVL